MMGTLEPLITVALDLVAALEQAGIDYALGGAIAYGIWGEPRGTKDIDVIVFLGPDTLHLVFDVLEKMGAELDRDQLRLRAVETGMFATNVRRYRVDVFIPDIPLYDSARTRRRRAMLEGRSVLVWSAEDITLFKLMFYRPKDLLDVEKLLEINRDSLDFEYILGWLLEMVGPQDERTQWFERKAADLRKRMSG